MAGFFTLLDGGMGRELARRGAPFHQPEWSALALIEAPHRVRETHVAFARAGADVLTTNAYALVPYHIGETMFAQRAFELSRLSATLAREAADAMALELARPRARVAGCLPPLFGSYRPDMFDAFEAVRLIEPLIGGMDPHVDLWLLETMSSLAEAAFVLQRLADDRRAKSVSFTLRDTLDDGRAFLRSGESIEDAVDLTRDQGGVAVLFNCSRAEVMAPAIAAAVERVAMLGGGLEVGCYPNAFAAHAGNGAANQDILGMRADLDSAAFCAFAESWLELGATIIGGCCGIGPEHIAALDEVRARGRAA